MAVVMEQLEQELAAFRNKARADRQRLHLLEAQLDEKEDKMAALLELKIEGTAAENLTVLKQPDVNNHAMGDVKPSDEAALRETVQTLQNTNQAFIKALSDADQIWATLEEDYNQRLMNMENHYQTKLQRVLLEVEQLSAEATRLTELEEANKALETRIEEILEEVSSKTERLKLAEREKAVLMGQVERLNEALLEEKRANAQRLEEEKKVSEQQLEEEKNASEQQLQEEKRALEQKMAELTVELSRKNAEVSELEANTSELREVSNFDAMNDTIELNITLRLEDLLNSSSSLSQHALEDILASPPRELPAVSSSTNFEMITARTATLVSEMFDMVLTLQAPLTENLPDEKPLSASMEKLEEKPDEVEAEVSELTVKGERLLEALKLLENKSKAKDSELGILESELKESMAELESLTKPTVSSLQLALDNLHTKCRTKTGITSAVMGMHKDHSHQEDASSAKSYAPSEASASPTRSSNRSNASSKGTSMKKDLVGEAQTSRNKVEKYLEESGDASRTCRDLHLHRSNPLAHIAPIFPIKNIRKVGTASLMVTWDISRIPNSVTGYEISVNGEVCHYVRDRNRSRAILHDLTMTSRMVVCVHPVGTEGRILTTASAVFPPLSR